MKRNFLIKIFLLIGTFCFKQNLMGQKFTLKSTDFINNGSIPEKFSCNGTSPGLVISNIPIGTKSLILTIEDPDAKNGDGRRKTFIHLISQFDANVKEISEGRINSIAKKIVRNDNGTQDYFGPCPPKGPPHSYFFTLVAINKPIDISNNTTDYFRNTWNYKNTSQTSRFIVEMKDNITGIAQLMGKFGKK